MIRPSPADIIERTTCLVTTIGANVLSLTRRSISGVGMVASTPSVPIPALLTKPHIGP